MADRLLFLLIGVLLKQTIDEFKELVKWRAAELEKRRDEIATYRPVPAVRAGTAEAHTAIMQAQHQQSIAPKVAKLNRRIAITRYVPLLVYALLTIGLILLAPWITQTS